VFCSETFAAPVDPFYAKCTDGKTQRYDSGNGLDMFGKNIPDYSRGWTTDKWGGLDVIWEGGNQLKVAGQYLVVLTAEEGVISAVTPSQGIAVNVYSFLIDIEIKEALYGQLQASSLGENRAIKARSQNLYCEIKKLQ
tara:strand:+ start:12507 stop:12920 length:414 start_codon:yes stop_codon:yes gene_type:complete